MHASSNPCTAIWGGRSTHTCVCVPAFSGKREKQLRMVTWTISHEGTSPMSRWPLYTRVLPPFRIANLPLSQQTFVPCLCKRSFIGTQAPFFHKYVFLYKLVCPRFLQVTPCPWYGCGGRSWRYSVHGCCVRHSFASGARDSIVS